MRRSKLNLKVILKITQTIINEKPLTFHGRPRTYSDALIISIFPYQTLKNFSYRESLEEASDILEQIPTLSTYHYRVSKLPKSLHKELSKNSEQKKVLGFLYSDGTDFGFKDLFPQGYQESEK